MSKPKLLWCSDLGVETGFARVSHNILGWLGSRWERVGLGVNYKGDPHPYPFKIYPCVAGGDMWGFGRFAELIKSERPDVILIQSDAWIVETFCQISADIEDCPPIVAYMPVDASGMKRSTATGINKLSSALFYTEFAVEQARRAGYEGPATAVYMGVRRELYQPKDREASRRKLLPEIPDDAFLIGNVNRNQPRKRLDLTIQYFAEWMKRGGNGYLYLHCLREDIGWDLQEIAHYYGVADRLYMPTADSHAEMLPESAMPTVYSALDVQVSTCMGEGFGLTTLESMACGTPQILPDFAALGEWPKGAVHSVPVEHGQANIGFRGFGIGATPIKEEFIHALNLVSRDPDYRAELSRKAFDRAAEPQFQWANVARRFDEELHAVLSRHAKAAA